MASGPHQAPSILYLSPLSPSRRLCVMGHTRPRLARRALWPPPGALATPPPADPAPCLASPTRESPGDWPSPATEQPGLDDPEARAHTHPGHDAPAPRQEPPVAPSAPCPRTPPAPTRPTSSTCAQRPSVVSVSSFVNGVHCVRYSLSPLMAAMKTSHCFFPPACPLLSPLPCINPVEPPSLSPSPSLLFPTLSSLSLSAPCSACRRSSSPWPCPPFVA
jgi:hypothetical protein